MEERGAATPLPVIAATQHGTARLHGAVRRVHFHADVAASRVLPVSPDARERVPRSFQSPANGIVTQRNWTQAPLAA